MPSRVIAGGGCIRRHAREFLPLGKKAAVVTGTRSAAQNGSLADVIFALEANGQEYRVLDKVMSNPTVDCAYECAAAAKSSGADFVVAIGGGSPLDAGKAVALLAAQDLKREELFSGRYKTALPLVAVPTTANTGSEVTQYAILTNDEQETKSAITSPLLFPKIAFLDAEYLKLVPARTAVNTAIDALSHAVEGMLSVRANMMTDSLAANAAREIVAQFGALQAGNLTDAGRERLLYASTAAGMVIANTGTTIVHAMGYSLTYYKNIDHGRANGLLLAAYLKLVEQKNPALAKSIYAKTGLAGATELKKLLGTLLKDKESLSKAEIELYASKAATSKNIANCLVAPSKDKIAKIFTTSLNAV